MYRSGCFYRGCALFTIFVTEVNKMKMETTMKEINVNFGMFYTYLKEIVALLLILYLIAFVIVIYTIVIT